MILVLAIVSHTALCTTLLTDKDSTARAIREDTTAREETILYGPFGNRKISTLGYYATTVDDKQVFQLSSGIGIFNTLRGQVPNGEIAPTALSASVQLRGSSPMLVIDGLPFSQSLKGNYNLNTFEYERISVISSGNAVAGLYGASGMSGAIFLQSKTGEGYDEATLEVNSYSTLASRGDAMLDLIGAEDNKVRQWTFSNAVAYRQDFGIVDTRVSCNFTALPSPSSDEDSHTKSYAFRINTGAAITKRFNARVILDSYYQKISSLYNSTFYGGTEQNDLQGHQKLLQGSLALEYQVLDWLAIRSQGSLSKIENDDTYYLARMFTNNGQMATLNKNNWDQDRSFANLFVSADRKLSADLSLTAFTGYQYEKHEPTRESVTRSSTSGGLDPGPSISVYKQWLEFKTKSWLNGIGLNYREVAFIDLTYRRDQFDDDHKDAYSASGSFVYSEAFHLTGTGFSFGKIRGSFGKTDLTNTINYPYAWPAEGYDMSLFPVSGKNFEAGTDLGLVDNRITVNFSYFKNTNNSTYSYISSPYPGIPSYFLDLGELKTSGWEVALGTTPLKKENIQLSTKLTWGKYKTKLGGDEDTGIELPGVELTSINPTPDWRAGLLNQLTWKSIFFSFLIDVRRGGDFTTFPPVVYPYVPEDGTQAKLRDVSAGVNLTPALLGKIGIKEATLSVSGRNLWTIYSKSSDDVEDTMDTAYMKSGSLSLSLRF
jgi:hypothetical protein